MVRRLCCYARCPPGGLRVCVQSELMTIEASNLFLSFEPRMILVDGMYSGYHESSNERKRRLVVWFPEPLKPLEATSVELVGRRVLGLFEVRVVDLEFERYVTVITPGSFLYDYFTLTSTSLYLEANAKRRFYFEEEPYTKLIVHVA